MLTREQVDQFWRDGYIVADDAVTDAQLAAMRADIETWVEDSRPHTKPFGPPTIDGRPRFDMGAEHSATQPALRRVNNPSDLYPAYDDAMRNSAMTDMVADLIGPNVKFHHCKINLKLPGSRTEVGYHQDFAYTPHTNDDIVTALLLLDDMTLENGCLMGVPGSHRGPMHTLFDGDTFTGTMQDDVVTDMRAKQQPITGKAGSVCLMHTMLAHGSEANRSNRHRPLYICVYTAADAFPLWRNPMPNKHEGSVVRGQKSRFARLQAATIELPDQPKSASFFTVQGQKSAAE